MGDILKVWDEENSIWIPIPAIQGAQGSQGPKGDKGDTGDFSPLDAYPVGAFYISAVNSSPAGLFGGKWLPIEDTFLLAAGSTYAAGSTGGDAEHSHTTQRHALTVNEIPNHSHVLNYRSVFGTGTARAGVYQTGTAAGTWNTGSTGVGWSHSHGDTGSASNMPPYLAVYVWQRVA